MLTRIYLEHFKCFEQLLLPLAPLTLFSGLNASGKSTTLQALALLHQTAVESEWNKTLILNGNTIALGSSGDVLNEISGRNEFRLGLHTDTCECVWTMKTEARDELAVPIQCIDWRESSDWQNQTIEVNAEGQRIYRLLPEQIWIESPYAKSLSATLIRLAYISAERIGPCETYAATTPDQQTNVGTKGEFAPWFLHHFAEKRPAENLLIDGIPPTLQRQTEAWMRSFFPGAGFNVQFVKDASLITLGIRTSDATRYCRPQNVGYGLTHVLPILTSCLGADSGDVIMIENPEAHLHPSGQSAMGEFLTRSASAGIQIILETHSDHVLNGVRRAVKNHIISPDDVALHFFLPHDSQQENPTSVISPLIDPQGTIDHWPPGFFDQFDKDITELIDW